MHVRSSIVVVIVLCDIAVASGALYLLPVLIGWIRRVPDRGPRPTAGGDGGAAPTAIPDRYRLSRSRARRSDGKCRHPARAADVTISTHSCGLQPRTRRPVAPTRPRIPQRRPVSFPFPLPRKDYR